MADQTDPSIAIPSGDASTTAPSTALDVLSTVSAIQPEAHSTADDVQEAVHQLDKLTEIENGLTEAALEATGTGDNQQQHMQHAEELEQQMEDQVNGLNLPIHGPITTHSESAQSMAMQGVDEERNYASSEDAEGEIDLDLDLGGVDDDEYEPDAYGQGTTFDPSLPDAQDDAYNESSTKDEAMPMSTSEENNQPQPSVVNDDSKAKETTPSNSVPAAVQPEVKPEVEEVKPVAIRRMPGQQRRSPSYNMEPPQTASSDTPIPIPPPFLPAKPTTIAEQRAPVRQNPSHIDLADVTFPEGLSVNSPSVQRHGAWVRAWKGGESYVSYFGTGAHPFAVVAEGFPQTQAQALLELFTVARDEGDVEDARAWFNELSKENPTVVSVIVLM